jgi:ATP-dependent Clp protease ATP-binding subunit ClpA
VDRLIPPELIGKLKTLGDVLSANILGQDEVLGDIESLLRGSFCKLRFPEQPVASMLFLGATGVGKTETVNLFTDHLFGAPEKLVRFDMSEFMTVDSINILRGQNQNERGVFGYYYDRSQKFGTLLFDEIEKAHPLILDVFLQILSAGRFTVATGETLDLRDYIVVATSNIGSRMLMESRSTDRATLVRRTSQAATQDLRPETFGRFDLECVFNKLDYQTLNRIGELHLDKCLQIINGQGHSVQAGSGLVEYLQREGYSEKHGVRPMKKTAMRILRDVVSLKMLKNGGGLWAAS